MSDSVNICENNKELLISPAMYCWGSTVHGELGLGGIEEEQIFTPLELKWNIVDKVLQVCCGENHTLMVTNDGEVYSCGNNDNGQLGHHQPRKRPRKSRFELIEQLKSYKIIQVSCGEAHSVALSQWGQVFSWGQDTFGQLGHDRNGEIQYIPKIVRSLCTHHVVQIACGKKHTLALTNSGELYAWGANHHGQLGIGKVTPHESKPTKITSLDGVPIAFIACGGNHSFALSCSGTVFGWGKNTSGQLGLNNEISQSFPCQLKTLRNVRVKYLACGEDFSVFLTQDGGVFTCGSGRYGQLGHGSFSDEILPRKVLELMGSTITQISCGGKHTLAFVPSRGRVYGFGLGGSGQLGIRKACNSSTPQVVIGPWGSASGSSLIPNTPATCLIKQIFSGGDRCFVSVKSIDDNNSPIDFRIYSSETQILKLTVDQMYKCQVLPSNSTVDQDLLTYLETVFKSLACINASFLLQGEEHYGCSSKRPGIDLNKAAEAFQFIAKIENDTIRELIWHSLRDIIRTGLVPSPPDVESLRIYLTLPLYHEFCNPKHYKILHQPFSQAILTLTPPAQRVIGSWWSISSKEYFERLIETFKNVVDFIIRLQNIPENQTVSHDPNLVTILETLERLNKLNHSVEGLKVSYDTFHLGNLSQYCDLRIDYVHWLRDTSSCKLYLCNYPFLFNAEAKTKLLETDQAIQMQMAMNEAASRAFAALFFSPLAQSVNTYMVLEVSRENLVADALRELTEMTTSDLKKPLKVKFYGEEAEDAGGVKKEFFMLLLREIFDPKYGMFKEYEETRAMWFSEDSFEDEIMYLLIGILCGLAIYNFIIINLPFPLALYKKLLGEPITVGDIKELSPSMYNSLQSLLDYNQPDLEDVFCLSFEITRDVYGEVKNIPLKPNGENIPVTQQNKEEYVKLYVDYIFDKSVEKHYNAFSKGFLRVCGGRVLKLFHAQELQAVIVGNEDYNWHDLESVAEYKNGYTSSDQTIRWFWEVLHELPLSEKKKFLLFLTGSDRIPITGMKELKIIIQPTTDDKFLPVAHTCFNLLDLPRYGTKERLRYKLLQAIQQNEGFSLV